MQCHSQFTITRCAHTSAKPAAVVVGCMLLLACLGLTSGCVASIQATCAPYVEHKRRESVTSRARSEAKQAWDKCHADQHANSPNASDAKHGFITGYVETALGFVNSPPPVPARRCISIYTLKHGYPNAGAWYSGYHQGVASALYDGVDQWRLAPIDPALLQSQYDHETTSQSSCLALDFPLDVMDLPRGVMIDEDQYRAPEQSKESPGDLPLPQVPPSSSYQNSELIKKPSEAERTKD